MSQVFRDADPCLQICSTRLGVVPVRLVTQYRHLGGIVHHTGKALREARHRIWPAHDAFHKHKRRVFLLPAVPFHAKAVLYESLVLSVLMHGAGTWIGVDKATLQALSTAHTLMAARILRPMFSFDEALHQGPDRILALLGLPSLKVLMHVSRLRHLLPCVKLGISGCRSRRPALYCRAASHASARTALDCTFRRRDFQRPGWSTIMLRQAGQA